MVLIMKDDECLRSKKRANFERVREDGLDSKLARATIVNHTEQEENAIESIKQLQSGRIVYRDRVDEPFSVSLNRGVESLKYSFLPREVFQSAVDHYKTNYSPKFTKDSILQLKNYYMTLRESEATFPPIRKLNPSFFHSMIKLCQARAKLSGTNEVSISNVKDTMRMLDEALFCKFWELKPNKMTIDRGDLSSLSIQKQTRIFLEVLGELSEEKDSRIFTKADLEGISSNMKMRVGDIFYYLERLCEENHLIQKNGGCYELKSVYKF